MKKIILAVIALLLLAGCCPPQPGIIECECPLMDKKIVKKCSNLNTRNSRSCATPGDGWFKAGENCSCEKIPTLKEK